MLKVPPATLWEAIMAPHAALVAQVDQELRDRWAAIDEKARRFVNAFADVVSNSGTLERIESEMMETGAISSVVRVLVPRQAFAAAANPLFDDRFMVGVWRRAKRILYEEYKCGTERLDDLSDTTNPLPVYVALWDGFFTGKFETRVICGASCHLNQ